MRTVYKYEIPVDDEPHEITVLSPGLQFDPLAIKAFVDRVWVWFEVDTLLDKSSQRTLQVFGTGHAIPEHEDKVARWVGTDIDMSTGLVWHLYEWYNT